MDATHQGLNGFKPWCRTYFLYFFQKKQGTLTHACSVVLRVSHTLEAREPLNLFFTCVRTRTHNVRVV